MSEIPLYCVQAFGVFVDPTSTIKDLTNPHDTNSTHFGTKSRPSNTSCGVSVRCIICKSPARSSLLSVFESTGVPRS